MLLLGKERLNTFVVSFETGLYPLSFGSLQGRVCFVQSGLDDDTFGLLGGHGCLGFQNKVGKGSQIRLSLFGSCRVSVLQGLSSSTRFGQDGGAIVWTFDVGFVGSVATVTNAVSNFTE